MIIASVAVMSLILSLASPFLWLPLLRHWRVQDIPNDRSSHIITAIRGVGLAPATGVAMAAVIAVNLVPEGAVIAIVLCGALLAAALGLVEDLKGLTVHFRFTLQLLLGAGIGSALCLLLGRSLWFIPLLTLVTAGYINAANFMDGVDGISAVHGSVAGIHFAVLGIMSKEGWLLLCGAVLAAVFSGFAPWNLMKRGVFLGDVGSYLLGCLVAGCGIAAFLAGAPVMLAVAPALPYLADTIMTFLSRVSRGEAVAKAHRSHVYQRLTVFGMSHIRSALIVGLCSLLCSALAFFAQFGSWQLFAAIALTASVLGIYLVLPHLLASFRRTANLT